MAVKKSGLGKGLDSLIPKQSSEKKAAKEVKPETIVKTVESAKDSLVYYNVVDEEHVDTFVLRNTGETGYNLDEELDIIFGINYIDCNADNELFLTRDEMYHWLFSLVNCDYGLDNEEFEQFLEE